MARPHATMQQLSSACKAAADLVTDAAATAAAAQPTVALSDYEPERLEAAVKGSVVKMHDGKWGVVKFTYATRRVGSAVSIAVDFDGSGNVQLKSNEWSDKMEAIALGCLTVGASVGANASGLVLKDSGVGCTLHPKFEEGALQLGVAVGSGAPQFKAPNVALAITSAKWTPIKSQDSASTPALVLVGGRGLGTVADSEHALLTSAFTFGEGVAASKRSPILAALGVKYDGSGSFKVPSLAGFLAGLAGGFAFASEAIAVALCCAADSDLKDTALPAPQRQVAVAGIAILEHLRAVLDQADNGSLDTTAQALHAQSAVLTITSQMAGRGALEEEAALGGVHGEAEGSQGG